MPLRSVLLPALLAASAALASDAAAQQPPAATPPAATPPAALAVGLTHACLARADGTWCWGRNASMELGADHRASDLAFGRVPGACTYSGAECSYVPLRLPDTVRFASLSAGHLHTCGLTTAGELWCWGGDPDGQLGRLDDSLPSCTRPRGGEEFPCTDTPRRVATTLRFRSVTAGPRTTCGATLDGQAWCWGVLPLTPTGSSSRSSRPDGAIRIVTAAPVARVVTGPGVMCVLEPSGIARCWGRNDRGQLGHAHREAAPCTLEEDAIACSRALRRTGDTLRFADLAVGAEHGCGVTLGGELYCWGSNAMGQLGLGTVDSTPRTTPRRVATTLRFRSVAVTDGRMMSPPVSCAVATDGTVHCWGHSPEMLPDSAGVACGHPVDRLTCIARPVPVRTVEPMTTVGTGLGHACTLTATGVAWCWGGNAGGALGIADTADVSRTPRPVALLAAVRAPRGEPLDVQRGQAMVRLPDQGRTLTGRATFCAQGRGASPFSLRLAFVYDSSERAIVIEGARRPQRGVRLDDGTGGYRGAIQRRAGIQRWHVATGGVMRLQAAPATELRGSLDATFAIRYPGDAPDSTYAEVAFHAVEQCAGAPVLAGTPAAAGAGVAPDTAGGPVNSGRIEALDGEVVSLRFYEASREGLPRPQRVYRTRFVRGETRFIFTEITTRHAATGREVPVEFECTYQRDGSSVPAPVTIRTTVQPTWVNSYFNNGRGADSAGSFLPGRFTVLCRTEGRLVARGSFEVTSGEAVDDLPAGSRVRITFFAVPGGVLPPRDSRRQTDGFSDADTHYGLQLHIAYTGGRVGSAVPIRCTTTNRGRVVDSWTGSLRIDQAQDALLLAFSRLRPTGGWRPQEQFEVVCATTAREIVRDSFTVRRY